MMVITSSYELIWLEGNFLRHLEVNEENICDNSHKIKMHKFEEIQEVISNRNLNSFNKN